MGDLQGKPKAHSGASALSLSRLRRAFGAAFAGIAAVWQREGNFRIQATAGTLALALALLLRADPVPIVLVSALVLSLEMMNSALEATLDHLAPETHPLVKRAKDAAAGAVLLASIASVGVGLLVLGPPLWRLVFS